MDFSISLSLGRYGLIDLVLVACISGIESPVSGEVTGESGVISEGECEDIICVDQPHKFGEGPMFSRDAMRSLIKALLLYEFERMRCSPLSVGEPNRLFF